MRVGWLSALWPLKLHVPCAAFLRKQADANFAGCRVGHHGDDFIMKRAAQYRDGAGGTVRKNAHFSGIVQREVDAVIRRGDDPHILGHLGIIADDLDLILVTFAGLAWPIKGHDHFGHGGGGEEGEGGDGHRRFHINYLFNGCLSRIAPATLNKKISFARYLGGGCAV